MLRRGLLYSLFAPFFARFIPKPKSIIETVNEGINPKWNGAVGETVWFLKSNQYLDFIACARGAYFKNVVVEGDKVTGWITQTIRVDSPMVAMKVTLPKDKSF